MNLAPFLETTMSIKLHMVAAMLALLLGTLILWRRKGTSAHKLGGRIWVGLMVVVALSSFFIHEIRLWGDFSPIHLISIFTLGSLPLAIYHVRKGNIDAHQRAMKGTYVGGLLVAGGLTLLPGRVTFRMFFEMPEGNFTNLGWMMGIGGALLTALAVGMVMRKQQT